MENIYIGLSGGLGQIYDLFFITVGTLFNSNIYIHHHSFAYLNKKSIITSLIIKSSKNSATHIVLCDAMKEKLSLYNENIIIEVLSNAAFLKTQNLNIIKSSSKFTTIGFLSNISFEKGIKEYFEVMRELTIKGYNVKGYVAGQIVDLKSKKYLSTNLTKLRQICYIGKIEALEKEKFFDKIDILLMPTKYKNEAEPLVIHEAMSHGVAVIAGNRGCISNIVPKNTGVVINSNQPYVNYTIDQIVNWIKYPGKLITARKLSYEQFCNKKAENLKKINKIFNNIVT